MDKLFVIILFVVLLMGGCSYSSTNKATIVFKPIKLAIADSRASLDFEVNENDSPEANKLLIGVSLIEKNDRQVNVDLLRDFTPTVHVKITELHSVTKRPAKFKYYNSPDFSKPLVSSSTGSEVVYADFFANNDFFLAAIDRSRSGKYRVEVSVLNNHPQFNDLEFEVFVGYRIYGGK